MFKVVCFVWARCQFISTVDISDTLEIGLVAFGLDSSYIDWGGMQRYYRLGLKNAIKAVRLAQRPHALKPVAYGRPNTSSMHRCNVITVGRHVSRHFAM